MGHQPGTLGSYQHLTRPSPGSRELKAASLTLQNGTGNGHRTYAESPTERKRQPQRQTIPPLELGLN